MRHVAILPLLVVVLGVAACGGGDEGGAVTEPTERPDPTPVTTGPDETTVPPDGPTGVDDLAPEDRETVEAAIADLAERTGAQPGDIRLVSFEHVTWNDGSLGCPEPGKMYTQALVDGSRTMLELDGDTYDYHAGRDGDPFLCERPSLGTAPDPSRSTDR